MGEQQGKGTWAPVTLTVLTTPKVYMGVVRGQKVNVHLV